MRLLFNATAALAGTSGSVHTVGLLSHLRPLAPDLDLVLLTTTGQQDLRARLDGIVEHHVIDAPQGGLARTAMLQMRLDGLRKKTGADFVYNKGNFHAIGASRQICFVENSNPFSAVPLGEPLLYQTRNWLLRRISNQALKHAEAVIFPTRLAQRLMTARSETRARQFVVPYGWELPVSRPPADAPRPFVLCVSSVLPHKNLRVALDAMRVLLDSKRFDGDLVIVGVSGVAGGGFYRQLIDQQIARLNLGDRVRLAGAVGPDELSALYRGAACLLMPSIEESFGIPLIESMGLGCPVVAAEVHGADADIYFMPFREICGEAAEYFPPFDAAACASAIANSLQPARRAELIAAGFERAQHYSWRAAAAGTVDVLTSLASA